jgi:hypothetical protein
LAKTAHPDSGGSQQQMVALNQAFDGAIKAVRLRDTSTPPTSTPPTTQYASRSRASTSRFGRHAPGRVEHDAPSFTIDVLPVEAFEALLVVTTWFGEVVVDDPPYLLEVRVHEPPCWVRLEIVPEAGASMVSLTVVSDRDAEHVTADDVRDLYVDALNRLGDLPA